MPATASEAEAIVGIIRKYLPDDKVVELAEELHTEVGQYTKNDSLRVTLALLKALAREGGSTPQGHQMGVHSIKEDKPGLHTYAHG